MESVVLNNRYRLLELVGSGGMAVVYWGMDTLLQRRVAVKVLRESYSDDPAFLARFRREAQAAANLDHPNIVTVYDVGEDGGRHYIVMEYVQGQDLKTLIRQKGQLEVSEALDIAIGIASGVGHAHKAGVIHCDIKPQNVLVGRDGRAMVTDFGIARALSESGLTESDTVWGSPLYFSPEQAAGDPPSPASDVYSIGVVLYEMLAGKPPFQAEKTAALALMHMREEPPPLAVRNSQVPPQLEWIVRKVMAKEPSARYRNAEQLAHVLEEYRKHGEQATGWQPAVSGTASRPVAAEGEPDEPEAEDVPGLVPESPVDSNRLTWILAVIALVAVFGLVPLWWTVYAAYFPSERSGADVQSTDTPGAFATVEPTVEQVLVPNLVGKRIDEARSEAVRYGLRIVEQERDEPGVDGQIVLEQSPAPGERVPIDSEITVYVSGLGQVWQMPNVTDYPLGEVEGGLESELGLRVVIDRRWSGEPEDKVLSQDPSSGTTVHAGDTVTLTVSGGTNTPIELDVNLADTVVLREARLPQATYRPGETLEVALFWRPMRPTSVPYIVFVHVIDADGNLVAQQDEEPAVPSMDWGASVIEDVHRVHLPGDLPAGTYQLRTGLYRQGQPSVRLPVVDAGQTTVESDSILVVEIEIE